MPAKTTVKNFTELNKNIAKMNKLLEESQKAANVEEKAFDKLGETIENTGKELDKINKGINKQVKNSKNLKEATQTAFEHKAIKKYREELEELGKQMESLKGKQDPASKKAFSALEKRVVEVSGEIKKMGDVMGKVSVPSMIGEMGTGLGQIGAMFKSLKGGPRAIQDQARAAGAFSSEMKSGANIVGSLPGLLGKTGKAAGILATGIGGISKLFMGWPGLVLMGLKAVIDAGVAIDTYIKNMNKRFAAIRGPEIMTPDVTKQFDTFNLAITNFANNIKSGLNADQVTDFMAVIGTSGKRLTTLNEGFNSYTTVVHVAAKASKVFGMDVARTGDLMGKFSADYQMNLNSIDKAFVQVAFDAQKSGLSTDRFWDAVTNASAALSLYGIFMKGASDTMKRFTESGVVGAQEAATATKDVMDLIEKADINKRMAMVAIAQRAGIDFPSMFKETAKEYRDMAEKSVGAERDKYLALAKEMEEGAVKAAKGDTFAIAQRLKFLGNYSRQIFVATLQMGKGLNLANIKSDKMREAVFQAAAGISGASEELVRTELDLIEVTQSNLKKIFGTNEYGADLQEGLLSALGTLNENSQNMGKDTEANLLRVGNLLKVVVGKTDPDLIERVATELDTLTGIGMDQARTMVQAASVDDQVSKFLRDMLVQVSKGTLNTEQAAKDFNTLVSGRNVATKMERKYFKQSAKQNNEQQAAYDDTFEQIRNSTLSIEDMKKIGKDAFFYQAVSATHLVKMSTLMGKIANKYLKEDMGKEWSDYIKEIEAKSKELLKKPETKTAGTAYGILAKKLKGMVPEAAYASISGKRDYLSKELAKTTAQIKELNDKTNDPKVKISNAEKKANEKEIKRLKDIEISIKSQSDLYDKGLMILQRQDPQAQDNAALITEATEGNKNAIEELYKKVAVYYKGQKVGLEKMRSDWGDAVTDIVKSKNPEAKFAGLLKPIEIAKTSIVQVDPGEKILPKHFSVTPMAGMMMPETGGTKNNIEKNFKFEINVAGLSLSEQQLAQRIVNEVRGIMYSENLTGQA